MFTPDIQNLIDRQLELGGIDIRQLTPGTTVHVLTKNSLYKLLLKGEQEVQASGGWFKEPTDCYFNGSTFGGSMLKIAWIGFRMYMEFVIPGRKMLTTSSIRFASVKGDGWEYDLDWPD